MRVCVCVEWACMCELSRWTCLYMCAADIPHQVLYVCEAQYVHQRIDTLRKPECLTHSQTDRIRNIPHTQHTQQRQQQHSTHIADTAHDLLLVCLVCFFLWIIPVCCFETLRTTYTFICDVMGWQRTGDNREPGDEGGERERKTDEQRGKAGK